MELFWSFILFDMVLDEFLPELLNPFLGTILIKV